MLHLNVFVVLIKGNVIGSGWTGPSLCAPPTDRALALLAAGESRVYWVRIGPVVLRGVR